MAGDEALLGDALNELEAVEARAYAALAERGGGAVQRVTGGVCLVSPGPAFEVNRVTDVTDELDLEAVADVYGKPHLVCVPPRAERLEERLARRGYTPAGAWVKLIRDDAPPQPPSTTLRVEQAERGGVLADTLREGFGLPPGTGGFDVLDVAGFAGFVAWDGEDPAGAALVFVDGSHAWLGAAATRPAFRGRGAQRALLAARIAHARAGGARTLSVETGAGGGSSYRNAVRAGFREAYTRPNWLAPA